MANAKDERWNVVLMDEDGNWKVVASDLSYEDAGFKAEAHSERFPHAFVDVIPCN
jgi:hypothetical protein